MSSNTTGIPAPTTDQPSADIADNERLGGAPASDSPVQSPIECQLVELTAHAHQMHKRLLNLEKAHGYGVYAPSSTMKYSRQLEKRFCEVLKEHDWDWPTHDPGTPEYRIGQAHYEKVIYLAGLIPIGRLLILWTRHAKLKIPEIFVDDVPLTSV
jgi:hypothetical protein